jgi:hydrogenase maturation protease
MENLRQQLESLQGRICWMGLGNRDYGDDGLGIALAERLKQLGIANVVVAGSSPERFLSRELDEFDHLIFLDAVEFGGAPGSVVFMDATDITERFPQVSTHKISLGVLATAAEANGTTMAWLLGVQPESVKAGGAITATVRTTLDAIAELLCSIWAPARAAAEVNA